MKTKITKTLMFSAIACSLNLLLLQSVFSQSDEPVMVDPEEYFAQYGMPINETPGLFPTRFALTENEMHVLDTLTAAERKIIEEAIEPPAVGIIRNLKVPIRFNLEEVEIPANGDLIIPGGRLTRINEGTLVYTTYIQSLKADEIRVFFSEGYFPGGVKVNLFSKGDYAFTQHELSGLMDEYGFYTTTTFADYLIIQVVIPLNIIEENLHFVISKLIHVDNRYILEEGFRDCYEDANCSYANGFTHIDGLRRATARLYFPVGGGYYGQCSGGQLNDTRGKDWQPFVLTANHCFDDQTAAAGLEARFYYWSTYCNSGVVNPSHLLVNGSNLIATNSQSDFTLILLKQQGGNFYLGWDAGGVANDAIMHSVHHPAGTLQKYSRHRNKTSPDYTCTGLSGSNFHYTRTLGGQTIGGSSGGVIVDADQRVRGQLYGWCYLPGADPCDYDTYYNVWGKLAVSYSNNNLQYWLYGGGASVAMSTSPTSSQSFGTVNIGSNTTRTITVYNTGTRPNYLNLEAGNITITGTDASQFSIVGSTFLYLPPNTSGTFTIRFTPTSSGTKTAQLNIPHNADNITSPRVITLSGAGNPCSEVISLGDGGSTNAKTFSKSGEGAWNESICGFSCPGREQVYSFTPTISGIYSIEVTSTSGYYVDYMWKPNTCASTGWTCIDDIYFEGIYGSISMTAGSTYYILLDSESTSTATHTFFIFLNPCLNVTSIAGTGSGNAKTYNGGGNGAWFTSSASACGYWCPGIEKVYSFVAPYTGYYSIQVTAVSGSWVDYMWKDTSCSSSGWQCIDDVISAGKYGSMYWTAGTTYYILLDSEGTTARSQTFYINPPDPCNGIMPITGCGPNFPNTYSGVGTGIWNNGACIWSTPGSEQIYSFVAPETGHYSIYVTSVSGGYYVDYMWKAESCSSTDWNCIDDVSLVGQYGTMYWIAGTTYYILLDDEDINASSHTFYIVCPEVCHANCIYDYIINVVPGWQFHSSSHTTSGCKNYRFYAVSGYTYTLKTGCGDGATATYDTFLELYNADCILVASNDDGCEINRSKVVWTADYTGYAYLKVRGWAGSGGNYTMAYNYCTAAPLQPGTISGANPACAGTVNTYSVAAVSGATDYTWTLPAGWTGSATTNTINATVGANGGNISVIANNSCGSSPARILSVSVLAIPAQPGAISGPNSICQGTTNTYSISPVPGATSYNWSLPSGWTGSSTGTSINATAGTTSGSISVTASNICGTSLSSLLSVSVTLIPAQPGSITGPSNVLSGTTNTFSIVPVSGATSYTWAYSGAGTLAGSGTSINLTPTSSGVLSVMANNLCGSSAARTKAITVYIVPLNRNIQNVIVGSGQTVCYDALQTITTAGGGTLFIVQNNGVVYLVAGQNVIMLPGTHLQSGSYVHAYIELGDEYCSNPKTIVATQEDIVKPEVPINTSIDKELFFKVFPNPTHGSFTLELDEVHEFSSINIDIYNIVGEKILSLELPEFKQYEFDLTDQQPGVYLIRVLRGDQLGVEKIIRQ